jgi:hypothetical protein
MGNIKTTSWKWAFSANDCTFGLNFYTSVSCHLIMVERAQHQWSRLPHWGSLACYIACW